MKRNIGVLIAFLFSLISINAFADNEKISDVKPQTMNGVNFQKIGVVDLQKIMQTSPQMKVIQQKLEKDFKPRRDQLVAMEAGLKKDMEAFKRDSAIMSQAQKKAMEKKIVATQQRFEREGQQYQQELSTAHNEAMEDLYSKIRKAISKVAKNEQYSLVLQKDAAPFSVTALDITDKVMKNIE